MTLTTRLSLFTLAALALVLAGFSATVYFLAQSYLYQQVEDRLESTLNMLVAVAELKPDGVEWEPHERHLSLDPQQGSTPVFWLVSDDQGRVVDGSPDVASREFLTGATKDLVPDRPARLLPDGQGLAWRVAQRRLAAKTSGQKPATKLAGPLPKEEVRYPALVWTAGVLLQPVQTTLRNLALALVGVATSLWLLACVLSRWLCRRALLPVSRMAETARGMDTTDLGSRLPPAGTADEVDDLGRAFNGLLDRLQESFERQRRFTGDASHQLRTPLTALLGQIEVALRRERSPGEYQRVLTSVQGQALHLRQLVEMLLFLARADAEARLPHLQTLNLGGWLSGHLQTWSGHPRWADLQIKPPDSLLWVRAQPPLLGQLINNLIENALKYSEPGTPVTLELLSTSEGGCLTVEDRGCGITPQDQFHVFEPFYRSPQMRRQGIAGVGLGLAIAQRVAIAFGARITVRSTPGQGSCFTLSFPPAPPPTAGEDDTSREAEPRGITSTG
jgi:signal transduction histidine kinase